MEQSLDAQSAHFREQGYAIVPDAVSPAYLGQLQEAALALLREHPGVGTLRNLLSLSPVFEGLIDEHAAFPLLGRLIGDDIQLLSIDMRTCPPGGGNMAWHVDLPFFSPELISLNTAGVYGLVQKSGYDVGKDGDLVVFDPDTADPYLDSQWPGRVIFSLQRGNILLYNGQLHTVPGDGRQVGQP